ncbi:Yae1 family protein [Streptomyces sp. NPDC086838]|uniref:Yae1 family protein n=1 Tax=Streptomyces sp. NPDC086838 TaxID=3365762 RepID=UPI003802FABE
MGPVTYERKDSRTPQSRVPSTTGPDFGACLPVAEAEGLGLVLGSAGPVVGFPLGFSEGFSLGFSEGFSDGFSLGFSEGFSDGFSLGFSLGAATGLTVSVAGSSTSPSLYWPLNASEPALVSFAGMSLKTIAPPAPWPG